MNWGISIILCSLVCLNIVSITMLRITQQRVYIIDTVLISACMLFCAAAYYTGHGAFYFGILLYAYRLTDPDNILKLTVLFSGFIISYFTDNNFYVYTSVLFLFTHSMVRIVESIVEVSLWSPAEPDIEINENDVLHKEDLKIGPDGQLT